MKQVPCSDWMRGWGFGGNDKLGRLSKLDNGSYQWKGKAQGRHNRVLRSTYVITFDVDNDGNLINISGSGLPDIRDVKEAIRQLNIPPKPPKQSRIPKPKPTINSTQLELL